MIMRSFHLSTRNILFVLGITVAAPALAAGCASDETTDDATPRSGDIEQAPDASAEGVAVGVTHAHSQWRAWAQTRSAELATQRPDLVAELEALEPTTGRDGVNRLRGPWMADPDAAPVLLARLTAADTSGDPELRRMLADIVVRLDGVPAQALVDLATADPQSDVRRAVTAQLWRIDGPTGRDAIEAAAADTDPDVRIAAMTSAARHPMGTELTATLSTALDDDDASVRMVAARALGAVGDDDDLAALETALDDSASTVRERALFAISRIDIDRAKALAESRELTADPDPRVARTATRLLER